jgi:hypothetical protein
MTKLIPLSEIPTASARRAEREARGGYASRAEALDAAQYELVVAPGCHGRPHFDPPSIGWCVSLTGAEAYAAEVTRMPGGTVHRRRAVVDHSTR